MSDEIAMLRAGWGLDEAPSPVAEAHARAALLARAVPVGTGDRSARPPGVVAPRRRAFRRPPSLPRWGWRLGLTAGVAAVLAVGLIAVEGVSRVDEHGRALPVLPGLPVAAPANAAEVLENAASVAAARPFSTARSDQWMYLEFRDTSGRGPGGVVTGGPYQTTVQRVWYRVDDQQMAVIKGGKVVVYTQGAHTRWVRSVPYAALVSLPNDPAAVLRWVYAKFGAIGGGTVDGRDQIAFGVLNNLLRENVLPPKVEATLFRAVGLLSGVTLVRDALNVDGRPAIALGRLQDGWLREEILLDKTTYRLIGERAVAVKDHLVSADDGTSRVRKGTVQRLVARTAAAIVDQPGQTS